MFSNREQFFGFKAGPWSKDHLAVRILYNHSLDTFKGTMTVGQVRCFDHGTSVCKLPLP